MITIHNTPLSCFSIVAEPHPTVETAAAELLSHLRDYCGYTGEFLREGETPDGKIYLGALPESSCTADLASLSADDSYYIRSGEARLEICGKTPVGTLYGVYHFLNLLGIDWLTPEVVSAEVAPNQDFHTSLTYDFPCAFRVIHAFNTLYHPESARFRARQGLNYTVGPATRKPQFAGVGGIEYAFGWGMFGHTFEHFIPYDEYFPTHPEYFSFAPGGYGQKGRYQICLTNPEVFDIVKSKTLAYLAAHPETKILSISQNDSWGDFADNFCKCPACQAVIDEEGALSGAILRFVNGIADAVAEAYPDVLLHTFAYNASTKPPKLTRPHDNVMIQLCLSHEPHFSMMDAGKACQRCKNEFDIWRPLARHLQIWTYNTHYDHYIAPLPNLRSMYEDTVYMLRNQVYGIFQQECADECPFEFHDLRVYLLSKLFRYPDMSYEEYLGYAMRFLRGFYGQASAGAIFAYLMELEALYARLDTTGQPFYGKTYWELAVPAFIRRGTQLWDDALCLAENDACRGRIEDSKKSFDFAELVFLWEKLRTTEERQTYAEKKKALYSHMFFRGNRNCIRYGEGIGKRVYDISRVDWESSPLLLENCMKTVAVPAGSLSDPQSHEANTKPSVTDFGFSFTCGHTTDELLLHIDVTDPAPTHTTDIHTWEQDSVELYFSETLHKTSAVREGDFSVRINAEGMAYISNGEDSRLTAMAEKTPSGYRIWAKIRFRPEQLQSSAVLGFEMIAHNIGDAGYSNTVYWNANANAIMEHYPQICGKLIF